MRVAFVVAFVVGSVAIAYLVGSVLSAVSARVASVL